MLKRIVLLCSFWACVGIMARASDSTFTISGRFDKVKKGKLYLTIYSGDSQLKDSALVIRGNFHFVGAVGKVSTAVLSRAGNKDDYFVFYLEPKNLNVTGAGDSLKLLSVSGSAINDDNKLLKQRMAYISKWEEENSKVFDAAYKEKNKAVMDSLDEVDNEILKEKRKVVAAFVKDYPSSMRAAMAIQENYAFYAEASEVEPVFNTLSPGIRNSPKGEEIKKLIEAYRKIAIGMVAPDITQFTPDSTTLSLSSLRGKFVLVDFWASWCGPCRRENPNIVKTYAKFHDKGFEIFAVSYDLKKERWIKAIKDDNLNWYQVSDLKGWKNATSDIYWIKAIPSNLLLDKDGRIIAKNIFGKKLAEKLAAIMP